MTLIHLLFDNNNLTGTIPPTIGLVTTLEVVRLYRNILTGSVPSNISNLIIVTDLHISNNRITGPFPDLTGMNDLSYLDLSNNTFQPSDFPLWFSDLRSLTTLMMERTQIEGTVPDTLFSLPQLQTVNQKRNKLSGELDLGVNQSSQLQLVDLQNNNISVYKVRAIKNNLQLLLLDNPLCADAPGGVNYCSPPQPSKFSYATPQNCVPDMCSSSKVSSPKCQCAYPYSGTLFFRAVKFSYSQNFTYYTALEQELLDKFQSLRVPVDSASLSNISIDTSNDLKMTLEIFPAGQDRFNRQTIFDLSNQTFKPPSAYYGPFYFIGQEYTTFSDEPKPPPKKGLGMAAIIGIVVGGCAFLLILLYIGACIIYKKRPAKMAEPDNLSGFGSNTSWMSPGSSNLKFTGSKPFSFEEIKKITNNFSDANEIGSGAYRKVYRGTLTDGQLVAVKRARQGSKQGRPEFSSEIELLSRVHHKNLVRLSGFCLKKEELILVYEYVPNGTLSESLSGKSGIKLDWKRRIKAALGAARGLAYLHELANPPIIHRDIKSNNILLDENLNAKVSDFGLSRPLDDHGTGHIVTEVKGTMGYLDPEYYMTQKLNEKSDVYSFGVVMLEQITARPPIEKGKYIVREVRGVINREQHLYGLDELVDPGIRISTELKGFEKYVNLALRCVEDAGRDRPSMGEVVKQLEDILEMAGLNPYSESSTSSATIDDGKIQHLYGDNSMPR